MFQALRRIHVAASDFSRSRRFYGEILGLPEAGGFENDWVEFGLGPVLLKLTSLRPGEVPSRNQVAAVLSTGELAPTLQTLKERGVTVTRGPLDEFTGRSAEILDPDGYRLVIFEASELHPDEEWVPMSAVEERVRQRLAALRQRQRASAGGKGGKGKRGRGKPSKKAPARRPKRPAKKRKKRAAAHSPSRKAAKRPLRKPARKGNRRRAR